MSRVRWTGSNLGIVVILIAVIFAVATVLVGTRRAPADLSPRASGAGAEELESHLAALDRAVEANDIGLARRLWRDAYSVALRTRRWEPMLAVGKAALRIDRAAHTTRGLDAQARQCYLTALFRARDQQSIEGVLLAGEAFAQLGDVEFATAAVCIADALAKSRRDAPSHVENSCRQGVALGSTRQRT